MKKSQLRQIIKEEISNVLKEGDGLWDNIRAKRARGEKPSRKGSKAYKSAVKAGKRINDLDEIDGEILSSGDVELAIVKSRGGDIFHIVAVDKKDDSIEAIDRRELSQMEICRMERSEIERRFNTLARDLFEVNLNEDFGVELEIVGRGSNLLNFCPLN